MIFAPRDVKDGFIIRLWKAFYNICMVFRFVLGLLIVALVILVLLSLSQVFNQDWNLGKLVNIILGVKKKRDKVNEVSEGRKENGKLIPLGVEDSKGYAQQEQKEFKVSNKPLRDKSVLNLSDGTVIDLPVGVKDTDVEEVVYVPSNSAYIVKVKDKDEVDTGDLLDMLNSKNKKE